MTENFESEFHKRYVGGEGEVKADISGNILKEDNGIRPTTFEDVLAEYRWYMRDPIAELPESLVKQLLALGIRAENDRKD